MDILKIVKEIQEEVEANRKVEAHKKEAWKAAAAEIVNELGKALVTVASLSKVQISELHRWEIFVMDSRHHKSQFLIDKDIAFAGFYFEMNNELPKGEKLISNRHIFSLSIAKEETPIPVTLKMGNNVNLHAYSYGKELGIKDSVTQCTPEEAIRTIVRELASRNLLAVPT